MASSRTAARLCIIEEQEIFRQVFRLSLAPEFSVEVLPGPPDRATISHAVSTLKPDILMVSARGIDSPFAEAVAEARVSHPRMGVVILLAVYYEGDAETMRQLATNGRGGIGLFLKHSLDHAEQLVGIVSAVHRGQVVLDPAISTVLLGSRGRCPFIEEMTPREREILALLANGYTNAKIARALFIDLKTVEHHINNMYSKLRSTADFAQRHPRVQAARLYLEATGALPPAPDSTGA